MRWRTAIEAWEPGRRFVDAQTSRPFRCWYLEHVSWAEGDRTWMVDRVHDDLRLGWPSRWVHARFVAPTLRWIFSSRAEAIGRRFGLATAHARSLSDAHEPIAGSSDGSRPDPGRPPAKTG